ncbi:MAG: N-acetyltransferase [Pseudomonadota bacterium]|nr:MAG: N-acetyltransferase [Pseudomonadota bacterium]
MNPLSGAPGRRWRPIPGLPPGEALFYGTARLAQKLSAQRVRVVRYRLTAQPVAQAPLLPARAHSAVRVERLAPDHPLAAQLVAQSPRPAEVIRRRFAHGAHCYAAFKEERSLLGFLWLQYGAYDEDEVRCLFVPQPEGQAAWDFDVWVHPAHRASRVFVRLWDAAFADLRTRGVRWTMSRVNAYNPESLHSHRRLGAVILGTATFYCAGTRQWLLLEDSPCLRRAHDLDGRPVLHIHPPQDAA